MAGHKLYRYAVSPSYLGYNRKTYDNIRYLKPRVYEHVSRYSNTRLITGNGPNVHESVYDIKIQNSDEDTYYTVTVATEDRLDIISTKFYNYPVYWWVIAAANNISDPFDVPVDTVLRIPPLSSLYTNDGLLSGTV